MAGRIFQVPVLTPQRVRGMVGCGQWHIDETARIPTHPATRPATRPATGRDTLARVGAVSTRGAAGTVARARLQLPTVTSPHRRPGARRASTQSSRSNETANPPRCCSGEWSAPPQMCKFYTARVS